MGKLSPVILLIEREEFVALYKYISAVSVVGVATAMPCTPLAELIGVNAEKLLVVGVVFTCLTQ